MQKNKKIIHKNPLNLLSNNNLHKALYYLVVLCLLMTSCTKNAKNSENNAPSIKFVSLEGGDSLIVGSNQLINIVFNINDRNGDLGNSPASGNYDIYTKNIKDTSFRNYYFPREVKQYIYPGQAFNATCSLSILGAVVNLRPQYPTADTMQLELYIKDKAGNVSNTISIPLIYLFP